MTAFEKVAYLKGLADGLGVDGDSKEGKLMLAMIDVLETIASDLDNMEATTADLADSIDDIGDDMAYLEDLCLGEYEDDDFIDDDYECDGNCSCCEGDCGEEYEYEVTCPKCGNVVSVYESDLEFGSILCPDCNSELEFEFDEDDEDDE